MISLITTEDRTDFILLFFVPITVRVLSKHPSLVGRGWQSAPGTANQLLSVCLPLDLVGLDLERGRSRGTLFTRRLTPMMRDNCRASTNQASTIQE